MDRRILFALFALICTTGCSARGPALTFGTPYTLEEEQVYEFPGLRIRYDGYSCERRPSEYCETFEDLVSDGPSCHPMELRECGYDFALIEKKERHVRYPLRSGIVLHAPRPRPAGCFLFQPMQFTGGESGTYFLLPDEVHCWLDKLAPPCKNMAFRVWSALPEEYDECREWIDPLLEESEQPEVIESPPESENAPPIILFPSALRDERSDGR